MSGTAGAGLPICWRPAVMPCRIASAIIACMLEGSRGPAGSEGLRSAAVRVKVAGACGLTWPLAISRLLYVSTVPQMSASARDSPGLSSEIWSHWIAWMEPS